MAIKTNQELAQAVNEAIKESGIKKTFLLRSLDYQGKDWINYYKNNHFRLMMQTRY